MASLHHILASSDPASPLPDEMSSMPPTPAHRPPPPPEVPADDATPDDTPNPSIAASTRRNASGTVSSVFAGNKIRHLKKEDGIPLWRKDVQYDFLRLVFYDDTPCFTRVSDGSAGHTFADIYIDAMAKSSKCSKILKEKLLQDQEGAISMAMVCLLVNLGRMNTTLNFFPEMRAQLRTYHSIPALQAHQDPTAYKQLQDAPRLKSILKGATEDEPQPSTLEEIRETARPRTNPVNLVFVMSQYAPKVSEKHFAPPRDFFDLIMRPTLSSASRARAFLWLVWWYLESDFGVEDSQRNPFGKGEYGPGGDSHASVPDKVPELEVMTDAQAAMENIDTPEELQFGEVKRKERIAILASEPSPAMTALKRARKEKGLGTGYGVHDSGDEASSEAGYWRADQRGLVTSAGRLGETGSEYTRSPSPSAGSRTFNAPSVPTPVKPAADMRIHDLLNNDEAGLSPTHAAPAVPVKKGRGNWRRTTSKPESAVPSRGPDSIPSHVPLLPNNGPPSISFINEAPPQLRPTTPTLQQHTGSQMSPPTTISFQPPNTRDHVPTPSYQAQKRHRGVTTHQSALASHRKQQVDYTLDKRVRKLHAIARERREAEGVIFRSWKRLCTMPADYDSEEESIRVRKAKERNEKGADDDWRAVHHRGKENAGLLVDLEAIRRPKVLYAGLAPQPGDRDDIGEEPKHWAAVIRRASRRLERWQESTTPGLAMIRRRQMRNQHPSSRSRHLRSSQDEFGDDDRPSHRGMKRTAHPHRRRERADFDPDDDDGGGAGGGELDEEERDPLGEEAADAEESDDDDEAMGDD